MTERTTPRDAAYCAQLVIGTTFCADHGRTCRRADCQRRFGTDTDYSYDYFAAKPGAADLRAMVPDGWYIIERSVRQTPQGRQS